MRYQPIKYGGVYEYPWWGEALGFLISFSSMIWVPAYAIYYLCTTEGTLKERLRKGITPVISMRPDAIILSKRAPVREAGEAAAADGDAEMKLLNNVDKGNHV